MKLIKEAYNKHSDEDEQPDFNKIKKDLSRNKFQVFNRRDEWGIKQLINFIENDGDPDESVDEYVNEVSYDIVDSYLKDEGWDEYEIKTKYPGEYDELKFSIEEQADFNYGAVIPTVFLHDPEAGELSGDREEDEGEFELWEKEAKKAGFSDKEIEQVYFQAEGGIAGVGIIVDDGQDLIIAIYKNDFKISGIAILYIHSSFYGSGDYYIGKKNITLDFKNSKTLINCIDGRNKYSLGEVFSTRDWVYN